MPLFTTECTPPADEGGVQRTTEAHLNRAIRFVLFVSQIQWFQVGGPGPGGPRSGGDPGDRAVRRRRLGLEEQVGRTRRPNAEIWAQHHDAKRRLGLHFFPSHLGVSIRRGARRSLGVAVVRPLPGFSSTGAQPLPKAKGCCHAAGKVGVEEGTRLGQGRFGDDGRPKRRGFIDLALDR